MGSNLMMKEKLRGKEQADSHPFGAKEICRQVGISHRQLDYWVLIGVVKPYLERHGAKLFRRFSRQDMHVLQRIKQLTDEGVVVSRAAERIHREMTAGAPADGAADQTGPDGAALPAAEPDPDGAAEGGSNGDG
ncbi:MAG: MerR family transcriptional regulator [Nitrospirota bacterium]